MPYDVEILIVTNYFIVIIDCGETEARPGCKMPKKIQLSKCGCLQVPGFIIVIFGQCLNGNWITCANVPRSVPTPSPVSFDIMNGDNRRGTCNISDRASFILI